MSSNVNRASAQAKKVLLIAANPAVSSTTGWPIGFWASELIHPYWTFSEAGYEVQIASPDGGDLQVDSFSDPRDASGYSAADILSLGFLSSAQHAALLKNTPSLKQVKVADFDAVFLAGGQSPMVSFIDREDLHRFVADFYEADKIVAVVCHATCILLKTRLSDGSLLVKDKTWTGFANSEEAYADAFVGKKIQPFWIEEEARKLAESRFVVDAPFRPFALRDGRLITGQQQYSGQRAAELVVEALGR
ncbi:MAG: type 1 glutamine amidotransferase domain-containing protein [Acidobacteria bacterium]|nr:type 1 glutamine amidotransferase domain-containing protein [Acidobacteriota bacterium]MCB9398656.1 type 1 glutamine amidotransferase domain-containing protein [Acidobacteriota bacterium]